MTKKSFRLLKNICWVSAGVAMFFLLLGDTKNNPLTIIAFITILAGIVLNALEDRK